VRVVARHGADRRRQSPAGRRAPGFCSKHIRATGTGRAARVPETENSFAISITDRNGRGACRPERRIAPRFRAARSSSIHRLLGQQAGRGWPRYLGLACATAVCKLGVTTKILKCEMDFQRRERATRTDNKKGRSPVGSQGAQAIPAGSLRTVMKFADSRRSFDARLGLSKLAIRMRSEC